MIKSFNEHLLPAALTKSLSDIHNLKSKLPRDAWDIEIDFLCEQLERIRGANKRLFAREVIVAALEDAHVQARGLRQADLNGAILRLDTIVAARQPAEMVEKFSHDPRLTALCPTAPLELLWK